MRNMIEELTKCENEDRIMPQNLFDKFKALESADPKLHGFIERTMLDGMLRIGDGGPRVAFRFVLHRAVALGYLLALDDIDIKKQSGRIVRALLRELFKTKKGVASNENHGKSNQ